MTQSLSWKPLDPKATRLEYVPGPRCINPENVHELEEYREHPYTYRCKFCKERYALLAESVLKKIGAVPR